MDNKLNIEVYKFNHKQDYLPYYKQYTIKFKEDDTVEDLLDAINSLEKIGYEKSCNVSINKLFVNSRESIENVINKLGKDLKIEPISKFRAKNDLIIDKNDYLGKLNRFNQFLKEDELLKYEKELELLYYSSNSINYNRDYIGDHSLLIAYDIIKNKPEYKKAILNILSDENNGIYNYTSSKKRMFNYDDSVDEKVEYLFELVGEHTKPLLAQNKYLSSFFNKLMKKDESVSKEESNTQKNVDIKQYFENFNIAYYADDQDLNIEKYIIDSKATFIKTDMQHEQMPKRNFTQNTKLLRAIAADILLDAKDNNADFLIVKDEQLISLFDKDQDKLASISGREIDMIIISFSQFLMLLSGEKDKEVLGLDKHKVKVDFLASA
ncbi:DUF5644 domain-containing protein [Sulfurimonas sp.]|uniref:DUF5644 domain-containing protein n=1 Tax=Sulfurimonas sp. TaxID=2022749 RepID=UPI00356862A6